MGPIRTMAAVACSAMLLAPAASSAQTPAERTTFVTFSGPVSIPGKTLPAGTYTFRLADSPSDRHIVQVFDKDQQKILATLLAVPAEKAEAEGDPVITFKETPSNRPPAVHFWYYAGERMGNEFVYPKSQAMAIAQASGEPVMAVDTDSNNIEDWKKGTPSRVTATSQSPNASSTSSTTSSTTSSDTTTAPKPAQPTTAPTTPTPEPAPTAAPPMQPMPSQPTTTPQAKPEPTPAPTTAPTTAPERPVGTSGRAKPTEMPHTASEVPAVGLIGLLALAGAAALHVARRAAV